MEDRSPTARLAWLKARVDKLREGQKHTDKWLYERIGMTKTGYRQMWERDTVRFTTLESIATALNVTVLDLLDKEKPPSSTTAEPATQYGKVYLEDRVDELERRVAALERK